MIATGGNLPSATIIICTRNRPEPLRRCLERLREIEPTTEVVVVDNASKDPGIANVAARFGARYVLEPVVGVNRARNTGALHSTADVVVYLDDDAIPTAGWLSTLLSEFQDPAVMAVGGRILPGDDTHVDEGPTAQLSGYDCGPVRRVVDRSVDTWFEQTNFGGMGNGANMAFRSASFPLWKGFDERIGYGTAVRGFGDHNAFFRVVHHGYRAVYSPEAIVFHPLPPPEEVREKRIQSAKAWGAYMTLLAIEYPEHRARIARYVLGAATGRRRMWRGSGMVQPRPPRWRMLVAALKGAVAYGAIRRDR